MSSCSMKCNETCFKCELTIWVYSLFNRYNRKSDFDSNERIENMKKQPYTTNHLNLPLGLYFSHDCICLLNSGHQRKFGEMDGWAITDLSLTPHPWSRLEVGRQCPVVFNLLHVLLFSHEVIPFRRHWLSVLPLLHEKIITVRRLGRGPFPPSTSRDCWELLLVVCSQHNNTKRNAWGGGGWEYLLDYME